MFRNLFLYLLTLAMAGTTTPVAAEEVPLTLGEGLSLEGPQNDKVFTFGDLSMRFTFHYNEGADEDWLHAITLSGKSDEYGKFSVESPAGLVGFIGFGIYSLDEDGGLSVLFDTYTGGAHCCTALTSIYLSQTGPVVDEVGDFNGGYGVEDVDGDGLTEILVTDDRFLYAFEAYAFSFPPVKILKSRGGEVYDATTDPAFRPAVQQDYDDIEPYCLTDEGINPSACAGMLADAARLGRYSEVRKDIASAIDAGTPFASGWGIYSFCTDEECSSREDFGEDFLAAVDWVVREWGYLR